MKALTSHIVIIFPSMSTGMSMDMGISTMQLQKRMMETKRAWIPAELKMRNRNKSLERR